MQVAPEVTELEALAKAAGLQMPHVLAHAKVASTTYWRWKNDNKEPLTKTIRKLKAAITELSAA